MKRCRGSAVPLRPATALAECIGAAFAAFVLLLPFTPCLAAQVAEPAHTATSVSARASASREEPPDTLWIFDADFEDLLGDNAGWQSYDMSGGVALGDYWHKDTIRMDGFPHLGDSTWWCGTYHDWWVQPRGYGNEWQQWLYREMPLSEWSESGDDVTFEYDQRYAMELSYDYGYTDVSTDGGETWTTLWTQTNAGFPGTPGMHQDWNSVHPGGGGHITLDLSEFAGLDIFVRYRFESDGGYSSQDQYDNGSTHSVLDGAWQLDNFEFEVNDVTVWLDDCESLGENGWVHHSTPQGEQVGVAFRRLFEPDTHRGATCNAGTGWMMAAVDSVTGRMVDGQRSLLMTPPIDISGAESVVVEYDLWHDFPLFSEDRTYCRVATNDTSVGLDRDAYFQSYSPSRSLWYLTLEGRFEGPAWATLTKDISSADYRGNWISVGWGACNDYPAPAEDHTAGLFLDRARIGITLEQDSRTFWNQNPQKRWYDVFSTDLIYWWDNEIWVEDPDGIAYVRVITSVDGGLTWQDRDMSISYDHVWDIDTPLDLFVPGTRAIYYYEASDNLGNTTIFPVEAPDETFEFSFLPINGSVEDPAILVVDKRRAKTPGDDRRYTHEAEYYITEALNILGFEYDVYDATGSYDAGRYYGYGDKAAGPRDSLAYTCYDTHIWLTGDMIRWTVEDDFDQTYLMNWLSESTPESPHCLFLYGNNIGWDLMEEGNEVDGFFTDWLGATYEEYHAGAHLRSDVPDTSIRVRDAGLGLMTHDDGECRLRCACPDLQYVDVVSPAPGGGAVTALEYVNGLGEVRPAGVVKVDSLTGYRIVYLPFGIELMNDGLDGSGHYVNGIDDRLDLVGNIMEYFGKPPTGTPTGAEKGEVFANRLGHARPNPFNPSTTIEYSLAGSSRVTIRVYDVAGRVVRTLVDGEAEPGEHVIVWDGRTDSSERAASGVYFVKMEASGHADAFRATGKLVLLK